MLFRPVVMLRRLFALLLVVASVGAADGVEAGERPKITLLAVGYPGAGKGTAGQLLVKRLRAAGVSAGHFSGGDHLRARATALSQDPANPRGYDGAFRLALDEIKGKSQIGIAQAGLGEDLPDVLVMDGPRSPRDVAALRADVPHLIVLALDAPAPVRARRLGLRKRDGHESAASVGRRDTKDKARGLDDVLAAADEHIANDRGVRTLERGLAPLARRLTDAVSAP